MQFSIAISPAESQPIELFQFGRGRLHLSPSEDGEAPSGVSWEQFALLASLCRSILLLRLVVAFNLFLFLF